ncbi:MAG TPA: DUF4832 domain-containing protein [Verrucomicrobiae bacterium]
MNSNCLKSKVRPGWHVGWTALAGFLWLALTFPPFATRANDAEITKILPKESDELLPNPGMGWQTFGRFADEDKNLKGLPSASAYFRFYWREIEAADGQIDFARFDELLVHARRAGQKLAFRIMCTGSAEYLDVPAWLKEQGCRGFEFNYEGARHWVPDFADSRFQEAHYRLIRELGRRYDGHPEMDLVDIGSVGLWGEWHMSGTTQVDTGKPVPLPDVKLRLEIIDAWCRAFPKTSKVILIGSDEGMSQASAKGYGWRADCLGDMGGFSKTWNHMDNFYLQQLERTTAQDTWQKGPVAFESCWDMRKWKEAGWDIRFIFDYALRCHASYLNNKSAPIPDGTRAEIERFVRRLGYRLVLRSLEHPARIKAGTEVPAALEWENTGVAPPYRDYRVAIRLRSATPKDSASTVITSGESIRGWLPGPHKSGLRLGVPERTGPGRYELAIGLLAIGGEVPAVRLAIEGRAQDGWYPLSHVDVR